MRQTGTKFLATGINIAQFSDVGLQSTVHSLQPEHPMGGCKTNSLTSGSAAVVGAVSIEEIAFDEGAESEDVFGTRAVPAHAGKFCALGNNVSARALDGTGTDEVALAAESSIGHACRVFVEVFDLGRNRLRRG